MGQTYASYIGRVIYEDFQTGLSCESAFRPGFDGGGGLDDAEVGINATVGLRVLLFDPEFYIVEAMYQV